MSTFADLGVPARLIEVLAKQSIIEPFPIQEATIPDLMAGRDVLGRAPTGSGKTLAFGLPLVTMVGKATARRPRAMVLAPTRELAEQIARELAPLARVTGRAVAAVYGGVGYEPQRNALRKGADIVVATPGRLADLIDEGAVSLGDVDLVVIDEADRMADMGFMPQVRRLLDKTNPVRQTILFSATLDSDVAALTERYQTDPVRHEVGDNEDHLEAAHYFWRVDASERIDITAEIIESATPTLVFTRTRHGADKVARQLYRMGVKAEAIHGGRSQSQRTRALKAFGDGKVDALIATDVAARGIHVDGITSVVHFDLARTTRIISIDRAVPPGRGRRGGRVAGPDRSDGRPSVPATTGRGSRCPPRSGQRLAFGQRRKSHRRASARPRSRRTQDRLPVPRSPPPAPLEGKGPSPTSV